MLVLMTDDERLPDPAAAARLLPKGAMIVVRARNNEHRARLAYQLVALARARNLIVLVANDAKLASEAGADGLHLSQANAAQAMHWRAVRPGWFISAAAHDLRSAISAKAVDAVFLSPVYPTASHPDVRALTPARANAIADALSVPVFALGGVTARNAPLLHGFAGIAAIGALAP